jgi:hypothetical protein
LVVRLPDIDEFSTFVTASLLSLEGVGAFSRPSQKAKSARLGGLV